MKLVKIIGAGTVVAVTVALVGTLFLSFPADPGIITEDDPRWDCATMGNRICGPVESEYDMVRRAVCDAHLAWAVPPVSDDILAAYDRCVNFDESGE